MFNRIINIIYRSENFYEKNILQKLGNFTRLNELTTIIKNPEYDERGVKWGNSVKLFDTKGLAYKI